MHTYTAKTFTIPTLEGISPKLIEEHLGLYQGYVKNFNAISQQIAELAMSDSGKYALAISELVRRRSFEFDGMRLHEIYFSQFESCAKPLASGALSKALENAYTPMTCEKVMKMIGSMRGPGWAILYFDKEAGLFHNLAIYFDSPFKATAIASCSDSFPVSSSLDRNPFRAARAEGS